MRMPFEKCASRLPASPPFCQSLLRRSEEHTSELQSRLHLVCRLLLEKKNVLLHKVPPCAAVESRKAIIDDHLFAGNIAHLIQVKSDDLRAATSCIKKLVAVVPPVDYR